MASSLRSVYRPPAAERARARTAHEDAQSDRQARRSTPPSATPPTDVAPQPGPLMKITQNNRAAELLDRCAAMDPRLLDSIARGLGVARKLLDDCRARVVRLDPVMQRDLAQVVAHRAPALSRHARQLAEQAQAARAGADHADSEFGNRVAPSVLRHRHSSE